VEGVQFRRQHDERTGFDELMLWEESAAADSQRRATAVLKATQDVQMDRAAHAMRNISLWAFITGALSVSSTTALCTFAAQPVQAQANNNNSNNNNKSASAWLAW
jgi:hypothetical protein